MRMVWRTNKHRHKLMQSATSPSNLRPSTPCALQVIVSARRQYAEPYRLPAIDCRHSRHSVRLFDLATCYADPIVCNRPKADA